MGIDRETTELVNMLEGQGNYFRARIMKRTHRCWLTLPLHRIKKLG
jgi:hypothetical protein